MVMKTVRGLQRCMCKILGIFAIPAALVAGSGLAGDATAAPFTLLSQPMEIATLHVDEIEASASYTVVNDRFELKMSFTEADGSNLNTRVVLADGQSFAISFPSEDDGDADASFSFRRNGTAIEMSASSIIALSKVAARY